MTEQQVKENVSQLESLLDVCNAKPRGDILPQAPTEQELAHITLVEATGKNPQII